MKRFDHTPGPWMWNPESDDAVLCRADDELEIVLIAYGLRERDKPILAAAPALFEACQMALTSYPFCLDFPQCGCTGCQAHRMLRAAVEMVERHQL